MTAEHQVRIVAGAKGVVRVSLTSTVSTYVQVFKGQNIREIKAKALGQARNDLQASATAVVHWGEKTVESEEV